jgi:hypothetical protein
VRGRPPRRRGGARALFPGRQRLLTTRRSQVLCRPADHIHDLGYTTAVLISTVALVYRQLMRPPWLAGGAALLYAVDGSHALGAGWVASRNTLLATLWAALALLAHDRWRRWSWRPGWIVAPGCLALSLLASEGGIAIGGYIASYAIFMDQTRWRHRIAAMIKGQPIARTRLITSGTAPVTLYRVDARTLLVKLEGRPDPIFRPGDTPMALNDRINLTGTQIEVTAMRADGWPAEVMFRFDVNLEDPRLRWLRWHWERGRRRAAGVPGAFATLTEQGSTLPRTP